MGFGFWGSSFRVIGSATNPPMAGVSLLASSFKVFLPTAASISHPIIRFV